MLFYQRQDKNVSKNEKHFFQLKVQKKFARDSPISDSHTGNHLNFKLQSLGLGLGVHAPTVGVLIRSVQVP